MSYRRRGIMLADFLAVLPLIAAITTISYQVTQRTVGYEGTLRRQLMAEAHMESLARQLRSDAACAGSVQMDSPGGEQLVFTGCSAPDRASPAAGERGSITYELSESAVTRVVRMPGHKPLTTSWAGLPGRMRFRVEEIAGRPRVLWASWMIAAPTDMGPGNARTISTAVAIGGGA